MAKTINILNQNRLPLTLNELNESMILGISAKKQSPQGKLLKKSYLGSIQNIVVLLADKILGEMEKYVIQRNVHSNQFDNNSENLQNIGSLDFDKISYSSCKSNNNGNFEWAQKLFAEYKILQEFEKSEISNSFSFTQILKKLIKQFVDKDLKKPMNKTKSSNVSKVLNNREHQQNLKIQTRKSKTEVLPELMENQKCLNKSQSSRTSKLKLNQLNQNANKLQQQVKIYKNKNQKLISSKNLSRDSEMTPFTQMPYENVKKKSTNYKKARNGVNSFKKLNEDIDSILKQEKNHKLELQRKIKLKDQSQRIQRQMNFSNSNQNQTVVENENQPAIIKIQNERAKTVHSMKRQGSGLNTKFRQLQPIYLTTILSDSNGKNNNSQIQNRKEPVLIQDQSSRKTFDKFVKIQSSKRMMPVNTRSKPQLNTTDQEKSLTPILVEKEEKGQKIENKKYIRKTLRSGTVYGIHPVGTYIKNDKFSKFINIKKPKNNKIQIEMNQFEKTYEDEFNEEADEQTQQKYNLYSVPQPITFYVNANSSINQNYKHVYVEDLGLK